MPKIAHRVDLPKIAQGLLLKIARIASYKRAPVAFQAQSSTNEHSYSQLEKNDGQDRRRGGLFRQTQKKG